MRFPLCQIIDVDGLNDEWQCDVGLDVLSCDVQINTNQNGESCLLSINVKLLATVQCYRTGAAEVVTDAYSAYCPLKLDSKRLDTSYLTAIHRDTAVVKESLELPPEGVSEIVDIWCEASPAAQRCVDGKSYIEGRLLICMLAKDSGGVIAYYERPGNFTLDFDEACSDMTALIQVLDVEYSLVGGQGGKTGWSWEFPAAVICRTAAKRSLRSPRMKTPVSLRRKRR